MARAGSGVSYALCPLAELELVTRARNAGLEALIESCSAPDRGPLELWAHPGPELEMMLRIKNALDPQRLLNYGRLYGRL